MRWIYIVCTVMYVFQVGNVHLQTPKLLFFSQFKQGFLPIALRNMWIRNRDRKETQIICTVSAVRNDNEILTFTSRLSHFENFPLYSIPLLWSSFTIK